MGFQHGLLAARALQAETAWSEDDVFRIGHRIRSPEIAGECCPFDAIGIASERFQ